MYGKLMHQKILEERHKQVPTRQNQFSKRSQSGVNLMMPKSFINDEQSKTMENMRFITKGN
jgi:hypothetical protein